MKRSLLLALCAMSAPVFTFVACSGGTNAGGDAGPAPSEGGTSQPDGAPPQVDAGAGDADAAGPRSLALPFRARIGAEPFACGQTYTAIGTSAAQATAGDFRFFVHDVALLGAGGAEVPVALTPDDTWQSARVALLDFENKTGECQFGTTPTNDTLRGTAPAGTYTGIAFSIGVPEDLNHVNADLAAAPLPGSKMNWDWTTGFIHFAVQLNPTKMVADGDGGMARVPSFFAHVGSTECSGDPRDGGTASCNRKNRPRVKLTGFDPFAGRIVVDGKKLFEGSDIDFNTQGTIPGCMSGPADPECPAVFTRLGLDHATGGAAATPQVIFSAEAQ